MSEKTTEEMIQKKGLNAPRLTPEKIDAVIVDEYYHIVPGTTMTLCVLTLKNGFQVTGESVAVSLENFDEEIGRKVARENARDKIWPLEGYLLKHRLFEDNFITLESIKTFGWAIEAMKRGKRVFRRGWNGKGMYIYYTANDSDTFLPFISMKTVDDKFVPWLASQTDMLSEDWEVLSCK